MKRILAILLLLCMMLPLAGCPASDTPPPDGPDGPVTRPEGDLWQDTLGEMDFNGESLVISVMDQYEYELFGDEESQETLDQLLWARNEALEDRFHVVLEADVTPTTGPIDQQSHYDYVQRALMRGEAEFDVIAMFAYQSGKLITEGYYLDWRSEIPYCRDSIKAGAAWWPKGINDDCTVCGRQYVAVSDICITAIEMTWAVLFNKDLTDDYNIPAQLDANTMYEVVDNGDWTLANLYKIVKDFRVADPGAAVDEGLYGLVVHPGTGADAFAFSLGYHYLENDAVNAPQLWTLTSGTVATINALRDLVRNSAGCYYGPGAQTYEYYDSLLADRHTLFLTSTLERLKSDVIHSMDDNFGVLPYPKKDETQKSYLTGSQDHYSVLSVPYTNFDLEKTGAVLEAISAYNNKNVNDLYYESIVTHKNTRDPDSVRMIDLIMKGRVYDLTTYHYNELKVSKETEGALGLFFRYAIRNPKADMTSYWASCQNFLPGDLEDLIADYESIAGGY